MILVCFIDPSTIGSLGIRLGIRPEKTKAFSIW